MYSSKIGRNDPCPCGSGKKYKKCCLNAQNKAKKVNFRKQTYLPPYNEIDYGKANINDNFLDNQIINDFSAQRFIYSLMLKPEISKHISENFNKLVNRARDERTHIIKTKNSKKLIKIMQNNPDVLNHDILFDKILENEKETIPLIMNELKKPQNDIFFELAVKIIGASKKKYTEQIIDIIKNHQRNTYAVSVLVILLGFYNEKQKSKKILWNLYHYFKEHYPDETFSDGPLIAMLEQRAQDREANSKNS